MAHPLIIRQFEEPDRRYSRPTFVVLRECRAIRSSLLLRVEARDNPLSLIYHERQLALKRNEKSVLRELTEGLA